MTKYDLDKQVLDYTKRAMRDNGFTCCNCRYGKVEDPEDDEDLYICSMDCWGPDYLKHSGCFCSDFEFKTALYISDNDKGEYEGYLSKEDEERYAKAINRLYKPTGINAFEGKDK